MNLGNSDNLYIELIDSELFVWVNIPREVYPEYRCLGDP